MKKSVLILIFAITVNYIFAQLHLGNNMKFENANLKPGIQMPNSKSQILNHKQPKSTKSLKWQWDTIIDFDTVNSVYARATQTFDVYGNVSTLKVELWQNNLWVNWWIYTYTYDASGHMLTQLGQEWQNNAWVNSWLYTNTDNEDGNLLTSIYQEWKNNAWLNVHNETFTYDTNGYLLTYLYQVWSNNAWLNNTIDTYTYDVNGNKVTDLYQTWGGAWKNYTKDTMTYDAKGNELTDLEKQWLSNAWTNYWLGTYTYDLNKNNLTDLSQLWISKSWVNDSKDFMTYNSNGNMLTYLGVLWQDSTWENFQLYTYTFDANGNSLTGEVKVWKDTTWQPVMGTDYFVRVYVQNNDVINFYDMYRYTSSWLTFNAGINQLNKSNEQLTIYPNPVSNELIIETSKNSLFNISISNIVGQSVFNSVLNKNAIIDMSGLSKGIYLIKISNENEVLVRKIIKQ